MTRPFIRVFQIRLNDLVRLPVEPLLVLVIETKKPRGAADGLRTHHVVHVAVVAAFFTPLFPCSRSVHRRLVDPDEFGIRQRQEPRLARGFLDPPLPPDELSEIPQLGIEQRQKQAHDDNPLHDEK